MIEQIKQPLNTKKHSTYKQNATSPHKKSRKLSTKKIMQPPKNHSTSPQQKSCNLKKKSRNLSTKKVMQPREWVSEKNNATPAPKNIMQPFLTKTLHTKITQPYHTQKIRNFQKNHATSLQKKHADSTNKKLGNLFTKKSRHPCEWVKKSRNLSTQKHHATSPHKNPATSKQKKSRNLSSKKIAPPLQKNHVTSQQKNYATSSKKHCKNHKTLPWENNICCQLCRIALNKSTEKVNFLYSSDRAIHENKLNYLIWHKESINAGFLICFIYS